MSGLPIENLPMQTTTPDDKGEPQVRSIGLVQRIVKYYVRRNISKAIDRTKSAIDGASLYDAEACRHMDEAIMRLRAARSRMR
jgi:hypothetical protein